MGQRGLDYLRGLFSLSSTPAPAEERHIVTSVQEGELSCVYMYVKLV